MLMIRSKVYITSLKRQATYYYFEKPRYKHFIIEPMIHGTTMVKKRALSISAGLDRSQNTTKLIAVYTTNCQRLIDESVKNR